MKKKKNKVHPPSGEWTTTDIQPQSPAEVPPGTIALIRHLHGDEWLQGLVYQLAAGHRPPTDVVGVDINAHLLEGEEVPCSILAVGICPYPDDHDPADRITPDYAANHWWGLSWTFLAYDAATGGQVLWDLAEQKTLPVFIWSGDQEIKRIDGQANPLGDVARRAIETGKNQSAEDAAALAEGIMRTWTPAALWMYSG